MKDKLKDTYFYLWSITLLIFSYLILLGNLPFINFPPALHIDQITDLELIEKIYGISNYQDFKNFFFYSITDTYHGLITFIIPTILSFVPKLIWGKTGLILSYRLSSVLFCIFSYFLLINSFQLSRIKKYLIFLVLMLLPYSNMFFFWPRCESYQYFFLFSFFYFYFRKNLAHSWVFIFLGLSFISRISVLPYILVLLTFDHIMNFYHSNITQKIKRFMGQVFFMYLGFIIGQPANIRPTKLIFWFGEKKRQLTNDTGIDPNHDYEVWIKDGITGYFHSGIIYHLLIFIVFLLSAHYLYKNIKLFFDKKTPNRYTLFISMFGLASIISNTLIMTRVKIASSYWYLQLNSIFIIIFFILMLEKFLKEFQKINYFKPLAVILLMFFFSFRLEFSPFYIDNGWSFNRLINRDVSEEYLKKKSSYDRVVGSLQEIISKLHQKGYDNKIGVKISRHIYQIPSNKDYTIHASWETGAFFSIDKYHDLPLTLFSKHHDYPKQLLKPQLEGERSHNLKALKDFERFVPKNFGGQCVEGCYYPFKIDNDFDWYIREDIFRIL